MRDLHRVLPVLESLADQTYRARAENLIDKARKFGKAGRSTIAILEQLGWLAGGGEGEIIHAANYEPLPEGAVRTPLLEGVYRRGYWLAQLQEQYPDDKPRPVTKHGKASYAQDIRRPVYAYWAGKITRSQFIAEMVGVIERGLNRAWREGASECGVAPNELTQAEITELEYFINEQFTHVPGFADKIEANSKASGGKYAPLKAQVEVWAARYDEIRARAQLMACADQKLEWVLNYKRKAKEHCVDCMKLNGRVYRASTWKKYDIRPQHPDLACGGWVCACGFRPTDKPVTPGRPPKLSGQK